MESLGESRNFECGESEVQDIFHCIRRAPWQLFPHLSCCCLLSNQLICIIVIIRTVFVDYVSNDLFVHGKRAPRKDVIIIFMQCSDTFSCLIG